jgi:hypothetical protein
MDKDVLEQKLSKEYLSPKVDPGQAELTKVVATGDFGVGNPGKI